MKPTTLEILGTIFFGLAVLHTFCTGRILRFSHRYAENSLVFRCLHLLGEIEVVFALWGALLMACYLALEGWSEVIRYQQSLEFVEPFFIFAIMILSSTRPVLTAARHGIQAVSTLVRKIFRTPADLTDLAVILVLGPLMGSFITEPAAMTVTALLLNSMLEKGSERLIYFLLAALFVNVSIGGALTSFAAPPILMVAQTWQWDTSFVLTHFGWKSALAVVINALALVFFFRREFRSACLSLKEVSRRLAKEGTEEVPWGVILIHLFFLFALVVTGHYQNAFLGVFLLFLGVVSITRRYQDPLHLRESLLVSLFLGGIIVFGAFQRWWLAPLLSHMTEGALFSGAVGLTAITDNAALTYLGSQVSGLSEASRYALVAGAISGGGLTIIANAPNAAGYAILNEKFQDGINPVRLLLSALPPTAVAIGCLWFL